MKILNKTIKECFECPYSSDDLICKITKLRIVDICEIADWCPLPDV